MIFYTNIDRLKSLCFVHYTHMRSLIVLKYKDVMQKLKKKGYSSYYLSKNKIMGNSKIQNIRENRVDAKTINQICALLDCQPGEILEYIPDNDRSDQTDCQ